MLNANTQNVDGKSLVLIYVSDTSGCSHIRLRHNALWYGGHEHFGFTPDSDLGPFWWIRNSQQSPSWYSDDYP